jgi:hypothetical protein
MRVPNRLMLEFTLYNYSKPVASIMKRIVGDNYANV